ncbi:MAG: hypothetical protein A2W68_01310 [Betaproteobacteria bacterium RIFCSPLOWO2_02_64_14]|nr:MAG: hypothetical protein A2W68_01310 [Betaproteobacteria bacterium RIFCSPLOWO2_02_64_14]
MEIVLDKSYLDGAPTASVQSLCEHFNALLSDELFFELMTTEPLSRKRCFSKLPDRENPVSLVPNVGFLLRFERERQRSCTPLTQHRIPDRYVFHKKLREGSFSCEGEVLENLNAWRTRVKAETEDFIERCKVVHQFFPELNGIEWKDFPAAVTEARKKIATDDDFVRKIYASFLDEEAPSDAPSPNLLTRDWAWFRWVQCQILAALRIFQKHQGRFPETLSTEFWRRAEHSMLDVYYVVLGALSDGIATLDSEIREDFLAIRPDAVMVLPGVLRPGA